MHISSSTSEHTLGICLPIGIKSEMVTISTAKGDKLKIVADAWHLEVDCHFEWEIVFAPCDVDITRIRAIFEDGGVLTIHAGRRPLE
ncbi:hypothetical protein MSAN_00930600 [Mycena sanguinolenta]|uniref:SHSP domain-containing protein n=1 Tax=Mycena sanguinolenta TaxID=230812 RepID=A0A8H6YZP0_9AGAR|nr:hypothetical protein MSAN_00930600 [Mycena sanguinolenta]